ncbi:MAG: hypothetical protein WCB23_08125, partial [Pseudolabrys sp.]
PVTTRHSLVILKSEEYRKQQAHRILPTINLHVILIDRDAYVGRAAKFIAELFELRFRPS